jgi:hypothetical protein
MCWKGDELNGKAHAMRLRSVLWMSLLLGLTGCGGLPPCHRSDVTPAYDEHGVLRSDAMALSTACMERIRGDLTACYGEGK